MSELVAAAARLASCLTRRSKRYDLAKVQARVSALKVNGARFRPGS